MHSSKKRKGSCEKYLQSRSYMLGTVLSYLDEVMGAARRAFFSLPQSSTVLVPL